MKRISERVREKAALMLSLCASNPDHPYGFAFLIAHAAAEIGGWGTPFLLAQTAYGLAADMFYLRHEAYAEAEALLRTGWSP